MQASKSSVRVPFAPKTVVRANRSTVTVHCNAVHKYADGMKNGSMALALAAIMSLVSIGVV